ncbi:MAG TPA: alpha/beta hydrolase, partial [Cyanobacteria bacterium UBA12227]|nr:alpha/beta hydrolase [Cyanobacteria bacterium UBA12227]
DPIFIWKISNLIKVTFPLLYRVLHSLKMMQSFASYEEAEAQARQLSLYQGWTLLQQQVFQAAIEKKPDGSWSSKFTIAARDGIFEDVMQVAGLTVPIDIPTLFVQPEKGVNRQD